MYKAFLSHSSADKEYVRAVASELGRQFCLFDEQVFENGETFKASIEKMLGNSEIFVLFASEDSIKRMWVALEIDEAWYAKLEGKLSKSLVFLMDSCLDFKSLPSWLSRAKISRALAPKLVARDIRYHLDDLIKSERQPFFEGRSEDIEKFERLLTPMDAAPPRIIGIQGLPNVGRRTFVGKASQLALSFNRTLPIPISDGDQLTEISIKVSSLLEPYSTKDGFERIVKRIRQESREESALRIVRNLQVATSNSELPILFDDGGVFDPSGNFVADVAMLIDTIRQQDDIYLFVVSNRKLPPDVPTLSLKPLSEEHTRRLITKIASIAKVKLTQAQVRELAEYVNGYPPSAYYAIDQAKEYGIHSLLSDKNRLVQFKSATFVKYLNERQLTNEQRAILLVLARYSPIPLQVLADATRQQSDSLIDNIRKLVDHSLVVPTETGLYEIAGPVADAVLSEFRSDAQVDHLTILKSLAAALDEADEELPRLELYRLLFKAGIRAGSTSTTFHFANDLIKLTEDFYHRREYREAANSARLAISERPDSHTARDFLIRALIQEGEWTDSQAEIDAYSKFARMGDIFYLQGFYNRKKGHISEALECFLNAEKHGRSHFSLKREIANCYFLSGDSANAKIYVQEGLGIRENAHLLDLLIQIAAQEDDEPLARETLKRLELVDSPAFVKHRLSTVELAFGTTEKALQAARAAVNSAKEGRPHFSMLAQLVTCLTRAREFGEAETTLARLNRLYARQKSDIRLGLECRLEIERGRYRKALDVFETIVDSRTPVYRFMERDALRGLLAGTVLTDSAQKKYEEALDRLERELTSHKASVALAAMLQ